MAKRGENIRKRKDGRWEGRYPKGKKDGKPVTGSVFGKTYQEAKEKLIAAKAKYTRQTVEQFTTAVVQDTFSKSAEEWLSATKPGIKKSSLAKYRNVLDKHLLPEFGDRKVVDITRDDVTAFSAKLLVSPEDGGKGLAPKTVASIISVMKNVMDYVRRMKGACVIAFDGLSVKQPVKQLRVFSTYEQDRLTTFLLESLDYIRLGILLCLYTGLRVGELCALTWGDISFTEQKLRVTKTMQRIQEPDGKGHRTKIEIDRPKSDCSIRDIPIPDEVFTILVDMRQPDGCFILTGHERNFVEPRQMEKCFDRLMKTCRIEDATMHTCRHSMATRAVEVGFDIKTLSEILGHASVAITMNRYVHPSMELKAQNMNKLCEMLSGVKKRVEENRKSA